MTLIVKRWSPRRRQPLRRWTTTTNASKNNRYSNFLLINIFSRKNKSQCLANTLTFSKTVSVSKSSSYSRTSGFELSVGVEVTVEAPTILGTGGGPSMTFSTSFTKTEDVSWGKDNTEAKDFTIDAPCVASPNSWSKCRLYRLRLN